MDWRMRLFPAMISSRFVLTPPLDGLTTSPGLRLVGRLGYCPPLIPNPFPLGRTGSVQGLGSLGSIETAKVVPEKDPNVCSISPSTTIMCEIDRTMKKHADTLLRVMEGVSARLTQLETRTHNLENLVDHLKVSVDKSHGSTHGKMRRLENILVEVQSGVRLLKDKQETVEAQLELHVVDPKTHSAQLPAPLPLPQFPLTSASTLSHQLQLLARLPTQFSPQQVPFCPLPSPSQPNQLPLSQPPHQPPYQSPPQYPQQAPPSSHPPYTMQSQSQSQSQSRSYSPNPPPQQPTAGSAPSQHLYNAPPAGGRSNYTPHMSSSGTGYTQLSDSHPLPMAAVGSSSPTSESRVPIDHVIDRVTTMGFPRDQVRATVTRLTENGQAVDLNVVLDKLMNDGGGGALFCAR